MTNHPDSDDLDLPPAESLIFWFVMGVVIFWAACFCAGLLYPIFM